MSENEITGNLFFAASRQAEAKTEQTAEARLVERVCTGEAEAFDELYQRYARMIHGIVLARVPFDEVDDIVQEVFLAAYKNLHTLRDKNAVGAWLAMIARNRANEFYRYHKPTEQLSEDLSHNPNSQHEAREILDAIRSLSEAYRETLILRLVEGMTGEEIAERTGLTHQSVRVNLHRGMKLLRQKLGLTE
jgi:RNA polymerase sigma-70 factor (ECF subfamily)